MSEIVPEHLVIAGAIRQAFEMDANPGNTVQSSQNPAQVHLNGFFAIEKAAANVWARLQDYLKSKEAAIRAEFEKLAKEAAPDPAVPVAAVVAPVATGGTEPATSLPAATGGAAGLV